MIHYLYKITNRINDKEYIGVHTTKNLSDGYMGSGSALKDSYQKYGKENFTKEIIEFFDDRESLLKAEAKIVNKEWVQDSTNYNLIQGGQGGTVGYKHTEETLKIISANSKIFKPSKEHLEALRNSRLGSKHSEDVKNKMSKAHKGKTFSKETINKIVEARKGFKHSEEAKEKVSVANTGRNGKLNGKSKPVRNILTGEEFESAKIASENEGVVYRTFMNRIKFKSKKNNYEFL